MNFLNKYPCLTRPEVKAALEEFQRKIMEQNSKAIEIEVRLGQIDRHTGIYKSQVSKACMEKVIKTLETKPDFKVIDWHMIHDFFYKDTKGGNTEELRTSTTFLALSNTAAIAAGGSIAIAAEPVIEHIRKKRLHQSVFGFDHKTSFESKHSSGNGNLGSDSKANATRVTLSKEEHVPIGGISSVVSTIDYVRLKLRKTFLFPYDNPLFKFDLSQVWSGKTKQIAEQKQIIPNTAIYEVECECVNPELYCSQNPAKSNSNIVLLATLLTLICDHMEVLHTEDHPKPHVLFQNNSVHIQVT